MKVEEALKKLKRIEKRNALAKEYLEVVVNNGKCERVICRIPLIPTQKNF